MKNDSWAPLFSELRYLTIEDVRVETEHGLVIEVSGGVKGCLAFDDFRFYCVGYERDFRDVLPSELTSSVSVSTDSQRIREFKRGAPDFGSIDLVHTIVVDIAYVVEVISASEPKFVLY